MKDQTELAEMTPGNEVNHFLIISRIEVKTARNNKDFLHLDLRYRSDILSAKMWDNFQNFLNTVSEGSIVKVQGVIDSYLDQKQIKIERIRAVQSADGVSHADLLPKSKRNFSEMKNEFEKRIDKIEHRGLRELVKNILKGERYEKYLDVPAGKAWHHAYIHGLLEHTLEIIKICDLMCDIHSDLNRDLLICGAMLHDMGKTEELTYSTDFDYSDKGRLLGHIVIASMIIEKEAAKINGFPEDLKNLLIHLVLSHQGKLEYATPVIPKIPEAAVLYNADELSAKTNAYKLAIETERKGGARWTRYLPLAETALYITPEQSYDADEPGETLFD